MSQSIESNVVQGNVYYPVDRGNGIVQRSAIEVQSRKRWWRVGDRCIVKDDAISGIAPRVLAASRGERVTANLYGSAGRYNDSYQGRGGTTLQKAALRWFKGKTYDHCDESFYLD